MIFYTVFCCFSCAWLPFPCILMSDLCFFYAASMVNSFFLDFYNLICSVFTYEPLSPALLLGSCISGKIYDVLFSQSFLLVLFPCCFLSDVLAVVGYHSFFTWSWNHEFFAVHMMCCFIHVFLVNFLHCYAMHHHVSFDIVCMTHAFNYYKRFH